MIEQPRVIATTQLSQWIGACAFSKDDLETLCEMLQESSYAAADEEIRYYTPLDRSPEQIRADRETLKLGFELQVTVRGIDDKELFGTISAVFNSPSFPEKVKTLYIDSKLYLKNFHNWSPRNSFELLLDFTKSEILDLSLLPSVSTPNASNVLVTGLNSDWVSGVYRKVTNFVQVRGTRRGFLHWHGIYDLLLFLIGFPLAFWSVYKLSATIDNLFSGLSVFVQNGAYVFLFFIFLQIFRLLFNYAKWVFPTVEYKGQTETASKHRYILSGLIITVVGGLIYDLVKFLFR